MEITAYYLALFFIAVDMVALLPFFKNRGNKYLGYVSFLSPLALVFGLSYRGFFYHRIPMASLFEFCLVLILLVSIVKISFKKFLKEDKLFSFGINALLLVSLIFVLLLENKPISLLPALQSPWFFSHILSALLAYLSFTLAFILGILYLVKKEYKYFSFLYKLIYIGVFFQTLLLVTGSLWALETWGRFWAWDPKEVWALVTYFVYGTILHLKNYPCQKNTLAKLSVVGFLVLLFTLIGVSFGLSGLHSY